MIKLPQVIIDLFLTYKEQEIYQKTFIGIRHSDDDYLFCDSTYTKIMYNGLPYNYLKKMCAKHNIDFYGIHSMRHFVASVMLAQGTDIKTVSSVLGHSTPSTTVNLPYGHTYQPTYKLAIKQP